MKEKQGQRRKKISYFLPYLSCVLLLVSGIMLFCAAKIPGFADGEMRLDAPEETVKAMAGFGGGMGCGNVCGAVTGGVAALSCKYVEGDGGHTSPTLMQKVKTYIRLVKTEYGSEQCKMLKPQFFSKEERCYQTILRIAEVLDRVDQMEA